MLEGPEHALADLINAAMPLPGTQMPAPTIAPRDWPAIAAAAQRHGLAPLLYVSLKTLGAAVRPSDDVLKTLRGTYLQISARNAWAYQEVAAWLADLQRAHIPVVLLKGCALATTLYENRDLRPVGDLDLLIPRAMVERARALALTRGYKPFQHERRSGCDQRFAYQVAFWRDEPQPAQLDLHWHPFNIPYYAQRIPSGWFWTRTITLSFNDRTARILAPDAQLLYLCTHFAKHRFERMIHAYDIALLLARHGGQINWDALLKMASSFHLVKVLQEALAQVHAVWRMAMPSAVRTQLQALQPSRRERLLFAGMMAQSTKAFIALQGLTTPGLHAKIAFWLCYGVPSAAYMRARYGIRRARLLPMFYLWRVAGGFAQVARSFIAMALRH